MCMPRVRHDSAMLPGYVNAVLFGNVSAMLSAYVNAVLFGYVSAVLSDYVNASDTYAETSARGHERNQHVRYAITIIVCRSWRLGSIANLNS